MNWLDSMLCSMMQILSTHRPPKKKKKRKGEGGGTRIKERKINALVSVVCVYVFGKSRQKKLKLFGWSPVS